MMRGDIDWTMVIIVLICAGALFLFGVGGGTGTAVPAGTGTASNTTSRSGTASGNQVEVLSRNQFVLGDVTNCYGDGSCPTTTTSTSTDTTTTTTNRVDGDRNVVIGSDGARLCEGADGIYRTCEAQP